MQAVFIHYTPAKNIATLFKPNKNVTSLVNNEKQ